VFHLFTAIPFVYVLWRFVLPLPWAPGWRALLALALLMASKHHWLTQVLYGTMFSPEYPFWVVALLGWGFCTVVLLFVFTLAIDLALVADALIRRGTWHPRTLTRARLLAGAAALGMSGYGVAQAVQVPDVHHVELRIRNLPPAFTGFRLVQLSDLHISTLFPERWVREVVTRTNRLAPDAIVISGDLIDGTVEARARDVAPLAALRAVHGVYASPGNHEYYFNFPRWAAAFQSLGMHMLVNQNEQIRRGTDALTIAAIPDSVAVSYGFGGPDLKAALKGSPPNALVILLSHRPSEARASAAAGIDVQLSGHTHGGMIRGLDQVARYANDGFISRGYDVAGMQLYVSNGTGLWNGFPIRLGVPAEITEFTLLPAFEN
jgi:predicted MPP superfamily phosphohydrolase